VTDYTWGPPSGFSLSQVLRQGSTDLAVLRRRAWWSGIMDLTIGPRSFTIRQEGLLSWRLILEEGTHRIATMTGGWSNLGTVTWADGRQFRLRWPRLWSGAWRIEDGAGNTIVEAQPDWWRGERVRTAIDLELVQLAGLLSFYSLIHAQHRHAGLVTGV